MLCARHCRFRLVLSDESSVSGDVLESERWGDWAMGCCAVALLASHWLLSVCAVGGTLLLPTRQLIRYDDAVSAIIHTALTRLSACTSYRPGAVSVSARVSVSCLRRHSSLLTPLTHCLTTTSCRRRFYPFNSSSHLFRRPLKHTPLAFGPPLLLPPADLLTTEKQPRCL